MSETETSGLGTVSLYILKMLCCGMFCMIFSTVECVINGLAHLLYTVYIVHNLSGICFHHSEKVKNYKVISEN